MIRRLAQWLGGIALHWFYGDVRITGWERIPMRGPILVAMNHQNALVDALLAMWIVPRDLRLTAKSTLGNTPGGALLMKSVGIIPLRRAADDASAGEQIRNRQSFKAMIDELRNGGAILVFPEGRSHNESTVAPLKTGLARTALRAREAGVQNIQIIPIGITFAHKAIPDSAVLAQIGEPIHMDQWNGDDPRSLTQTIADRLGAIAFTGDVPAGQKRTMVRRSLPIRAIALWGTIMHEIPLRIARRYALRLSEDEGEPAMYTMTLGLGAILLSYAIEVPVVWWLAGWIAALIFLASLVTGAYWAAYVAHSPVQSRD